MQDATVTLRPPAVATGRNTVAGSGWGWEPGGVLLLAPAPSPSLSVSLSLPAPAREATGRVEARSRPRPRHTSPAHVPGTRPRHTSPAHVPAHTWGSPAEKSRNRSSDFATGFPIFSDWTFGFVGTREVAKSKRRSQRRRHDCCSAAFKF